MIVRSNGDTVNCKIKNIDSINIYFLTRWKEDVARTFLSLDSVLNYEYDVFPSLRYSKPYAKSAQYNRYSAGFGAGFDYGGFGTMATGYLTKNLGLFISIGWAFSEANYCAGIKLRTLSQEKRYKAVFFLSAYYGFTSEPYFWENPEFREYVYGPAAGFGVDIYTEFDRGGYWSIALFVLIRETEVYKDGIFPVIPSISYKRKLY